MGGLASAVEAAEKLTASVVRIGRDGGRGLGFVLGDNQVLTSAHNLRGSSVTVTFLGGRTATAQVKGVDGDGDLAVLEVDTGGAATAQWSPRLPVLGGTVVVPGLVAGGGRARITTGQVCGLGASFRGPRGRVITDALEHTAPVAPGSSGGPVLDADGLVVGVDTHRSGDGFYLARPSTAELRQRIDALGRGESPAPRRLGVAVAPPEVARRLRASVGLPPLDGVLVREVAEGSPAADAGITKGDLIVAAAGEPVDSLDRLLAALDSATGTDPVAVSLVRGAEELTVQVSLG